MLEEKIKKYALMFETKKYFELLQYYNALKKQNELEFLLLANLIYDKNIQNQISAHKIELANIVAKGATVEILPEDRTRVILVLASVADKDIASVNKTFTEEFGPSFVIPNKFIINGKAYEWKKIAQKAKEIKRGLYNCTYFYIQEIVDKVMNYYKIMKLYDMKSITRINDLASNVLSFIKDNSIASPSSEIAKGTMVQVKELYKLTGRIKLEIDKLSEEQNFYNIQEFVLIVKLVCKIKFQLYNERKPLNDFLSAKNTLMRDLARNKFYDLFSLEELERFGVKLDRIISETSQKGVL